MRIKNISRTSKYLLVASVGLIMLSAILGFLLTKQSSHAMTALISERMLDVSNTAAAMINGDDLEVVQAEDVDTPEFQTILKTLTYFQENIELEYIYCVRDMGNDNFVFTIDPTVEDPGKFGDPIVFTPALHKASTGIASVDDKAYEDAWGRFYSSYSPVFNSKGEVAGIVAVDFDADWYEDKIHQLVWTTAIIIGASIFFGLLLALLTANRYHGRFVRLSREMGELSDGIEDLVHEITPEAEIEKEDNEMIREEPTLARDDIAVIGDEIRAMQNKLKERIQYIRSRAYYDSLTGLKNRDAYDDAVEKQDGRIDEGKANFSVVVLDINQLKNINDDYGHEQGDRIIREISKAMKKVFPPEKVYRIGGDEFAAILAGVDQKDNMEALRGLLRELNEKETVLNTDSVEISVSMGSAIYDRERDSRYIDVFKRADIVMYGDKRAFYQNHEDRRQKKEQQ